MAEAPAEGHVFSQSSKLATKTLANGVFDESESPTNRNLSPSRSLEWAHDRINEIEIKSVNILRIGMTYFMGTEGEIKYS